MIRINTLPLALMIILMSNGCSMPSQVSTPSGPPETTTVISSLLPPTETQPISPTLTPSITPTETAVPTPTTFVPFTAAVWADNVNVRTNPGYLFPAVRLLAKAANLTILGKAPGGEWMFARTPDGTSGWVFTQLIESSIDLQSVPIFEPQDVQLIKGRVTDSSGIPIQGVGFSVVQGVGDQAPANIVLTDASGEFFSFMPANARGEWTVTYNAIACKSNVWSDDSCSYYKNPYRGVVEPQSTNVSLPQSGILEFVWK
jgi:SH3-like domain-containing protein